MQSRRDEFTAPQDDRRARPLARSSALHARFGVPSLDEARGGLLRSAFRQEADGLEAGAGMRAGALEPFTMPLASILG
jgi:hypothetical protein